MQVSQQAFNVSAEANPPKIRLLDGVTVSAGPSRQLGRFFLAADAAVARTGVEVWINDGFEKFEDAARLAGSTRSTFPPVFDPEQSDIEQGFWLSAHNEAGEVVATHAARLITVGSGGLADHMRDLRLHYRDPLRHTMAGAECLVTGEAAEIAQAITGRVSFCGGMWCRKDFRGTGMVHVLTKVVRYLALTRWDTSHTFSLFRANLAEMGILDKYGIFSFVPGVALRKSYTGDVDLFFAWMDRVTMEADLDRYTDEWLGKMTRAAAVDET